MLFLTLLKVFIDHITAEHFGVHLFIPLISSQQKPETDSMCREIMTIAEQMQKS